MCATQYLNAPYRFGANGPFEFDCSGLVLRVIRDYYISTGRAEEGKAIPDMTAQGIYDWAIKQGLKCSPPAPGHLLFYGIERITHVAIAGPQGMLIEAGGAGRDTEKLNGKKLIEYCAEKDARVRYRRVGHRSDMVASIEFNL